MAFLVNYLVPYVFISHQKRTHKKDKDIAFRTIEKIKPFYIVLWLHQSRQNIHLIFKKGPFRIRLHSKSKNDFEMEHFIR